MLARLILSPTSGRTTLARVNPQTRGKLRWPEGRNQTPVSPCTVECRITTELSKMLERGNVHRKNQVVAVGLTLLFRF
jgi:hypothetical protein